MNYIYNCGCQDTCQGEYKPVWNEEYKYFKPVFKPCGSASSANPEEEIIIYDGGGVDGYN